MYRLFEYFTFQPLTALSAVPLALSPPTLMVITWGVSGEADVEAMSTRTLLAPLGHGTEQRLDS